MQSKAKTILTSAKTKNSFETKRLLVRPLNSQDKALFIELHTNEKIMKHTGGAVSQEVAHAKFETALKLNQTKPAKFSIWTIVSTVNNETIGFEMLYQTNKHRQEKIWEIGIMMANSGQNRGLSEEAINSLLEFAFTCLNIDEIVARFAEENVKTHRLVEKTGFIFDYSAIENGNYYAFINKKTWSKMVNNFAVQ
ncbi:GNAT family N-acetyltransferase [Thalassotalea euphylliae]|uniref:N-acetyltransferase n=1 Tax=Thalassotalea euphylliae TaxID=1655234 RepID=A0A3E0UET5_9GAMM|nr:GNAT family N-acetyltransferase [Thalassotalea euphylliae]REL35093.1 N-acetyltransferase [Thalassotalea euphylliae]